MTYKALAVITAAYLGACAPNTEPTEPVALETAVQQDTNYHTDSIDSGLLDSDNQDPCDTQEIGIVRLNLNTDYRGNGEFQTFNGLEPFSVVASPETYFVDIRIESALTTFSVQAYAEEGDIESCAIEYESYDNPPVIINQEEFEVDAEILIVNEFSDRTCLYTNTFYIDMNTSSRVFSHRDYEIFLTKNHSTDINYNGRSISFNVEASEGNSNPNGEFFDVSGKHHNLTFSESQPQDGTLETIINIEPNDCPSREARITYSPTERWVELPIWTESN